MSLLQNSNAIETGGYNISNSLRFQSASSTYLARTPASAGNTLTFTWSGWIKLGLLSTEMTFFGAGTNASNRTLLYINSSGNLVVSAVDSGITRTNLTTSAVYRDPSAWYHVVMTYDETNGTSSDRVRLYVNGSRVTAFSTATYPPGSAGTFINFTVAHAIGRSPYTGASYLDGYMTEVNFIDGQALTPSSFGETNTLTGQWVAKKYTGTYGTNGFYLPFTNGTSTTTLGADSSGNSNNWTLNNFTRSAGVSDCWMFDVPSGNGSAVGGTQPNSNYAVLNPIASVQYSNLNNANLTLLTSTAQTGGTNATIGVNSGKWYWEITVGATGTPVQSMIGIRNQNANITSVSAGYPGGDSNGYGYYGSNGFKYNNNSGVTYGASFTNGDVIGVEFDADAGTIKFYKNNVSQGIAFSGIPMTDLIWFPALGDGSASLQCLLQANFGQRSFAYTPPSGFKALCTANLPASTIVKGNEYMDATLYTGNGTTNRAVVNAAGFEPDLVWVKSRSNVASNLLVDAVRGVSTVLYSNSTLAAQTSTAIASLNSNGFSVNEPNVGADSSNINGQTYVAWQWDAGSSTVTNTNGSISSQVRANPTAGVSVVTWTGTGSLGTVGHGLGVAPSMLIIKSRSTADTWRVYHASLGNTRFINLNDTSAAGTASTVWNNTSPSSTVFTVNTESSVNGSGRTQVAYCFSEIAGFSKFGSYTGNGSADGSFIYTGFRPKFVMIKRTDTTGNWAIHDTSRSPFNQIAEYLLANTADAEVGGSVLAIDALSNGFKLRVTQANENASGGTYIYACFAESPFANSNSR